MPFTLRSVLIVLALTVPLVACSSQGANLPLLEAASTDDSNYRLGAGDKLHIAVVGPHDVTERLEIGAGQIRVILGSFHCRVVQHGGTSLDLVCHPVTTLRAASKKAAPIKTEPRVVRGNHG